MHTASIDLLSPREKEVLSLIAKGYKNRDIGTMLNITEQTVETHRKHIKKKLNAKHTLDLIRLAMSSGV
jgi:DNA-binding CsgD family transcriptional regulator